MKDAGHDDTVVERLKSALNTDALPKAAQDYAQHLVRRLSRPVRVSVLGMPASGKSQLVNMFLGEEIVPEGAELPTTEFAWGENPQMIVTGSDGNTVKVHGVDVAALSGPVAAFLRVELPNPILKKINLMEVVTDGSADEMNSGVDWVVRRTDIALWCTQAFDVDEQKVWSRVPDSLKDHAFLALTKADQLSAENQLREKVAELGSVVAEEFHSMFAVATLRAIRAFEGGTVDEGMFHASGGSALTSEVLRHADRGRRADLDSAEMFFARYNVDVDAKPAARKVSKPVSRVPVEAPVKQSKPEAKIDAKVEAAPKVENVKLFSDSIRFLRKRGDSLVTTAEGLGEGAAKGLIEHCVTAVEHLMDQFSQDESGCEATDAYIDELAEAQDMMVLMQVEDGDGPAADAVTLLLQLRRDMEMQLAA